jgi:diguanylate cyclase (GGDEF)-like protein/PAS domain S-box-containing protein
MESSPYASLTEYIDLLLDAICVVDQEGRYVYVSASFERIFGYAPKEVIGRRMIELVHPADRELTLQTANGIMSGDPQYHFENRYVRKDGEVVHIMWSARWSEDHRLRIAVARDITRRKRAEAMQTALYAISEATHAAEDLRTLFHQIHRIIGELLPASNFSIALYDEKSGEVTFPYHVDEHMAVPAPQQLDADTLCARVIRSGQALLVSPDDAALPGGASGRPGRAGNGARSWLGIPLESQNRIIGALVVQSNASNAHYTRDDQELLQFVSDHIASAIERKQMMAGLQHMALYDRLTQLPNRALFHDRMQLALARVRRDHAQLSLLYVDLNKFKEVNDDFGHATGDLLLQEVARRLEQCVRAGDTVARFGGDEFVILLENTGLPEHTAPIVEKIRSALEKPFDLAGRRIGIQASIGAAHCPLHGEDEKQLLSHADEAMYAQKKGRSEPPARDSA